jgi:transposase
MCWVSPKRLDRAIVMVDVSDDAKGGYRRIEVLTGPGRRRRWSAEDKARVVAETLEPGASVSDVARRWQVCPQQVFGWRRQVRLALPASPVEPVAGLLPPFVPLLAEAAAPEKVAVTASSSASAAIEIKLAGAAVRVMPGVDGELLTAVLRAVRCSSGAA